MTKQNDTPEPINDEALDSVAGGGLLLPAVQKVHEAAALPADGSVRFASRTKPGDGSVKSLTQTTTGSGI